MTGEPERPLESVDDEGYTVCGTYTEMDGDTERCRGCWAPVVRD